MLGAIANAAPLWVGSRASTVFEVPSAAGIPDVVILQLDAEAALSRVRSGFVVEKPVLAALLALSDVGGWSDEDEGMGLTTEKLVEAAGVTRSYTLSYVLPILIERGHAAPLGHGRWRATRPYRSVAERLITVEAKLSDWRRGLGQASRHAAGADEAWVVIDSSRSKSALQASSWFSAVGVGLATLDAEFRVAQVFRPSAVQVLRVRRELLAERAADLIANRQSSGPVKPVFGKNLTAVTQPDPRLQGVSAR